MATTTNYSWTTPDNTAYVKDGASAIRTLGSSVDTTLFTALGGAYPGLRLVKKQTIGTAVSTVSVTGAFSSAYENYKIVISGGVGSTQNITGLRMGTTNTGYYTSRALVTFASSTVSGAALSNFSSFIYAGGQNTNTICMNVDVLAPFLTKPTTYTGISVIPSTTGEYATHGGYLDNTTSYTSFEIFPNGGTLTGGTIYVYGYGAS